MLQKAHFCPTFEIVLSNFETSLRDARLSWNYTAFMTHHTRKELQQTLKHAGLYIARFFMQTVSNFWQTCKGQQIIQLAVCLLITLIINIQTGIIEFDKASLNIQAAIYFCGTLFLLVVFVSLVTAPFHLDREREELVAEKEGEIGELQVTIKALQGSAGVNPTPLPLSKNTPVLIVEAVRVVRFYTHDNEEVIHQAQVSDGEAFVVDFTYKAEKNSYPVISIQAKIEFQDTNKQRLCLIPKGFWQNEIDDALELDIGSTGHLTIALTQKDKLFSYQHGTYYHEMIMQKLPQAKIQQLEGEDFIVNVELIVKRNGEFLTNPQYSFKISLNPEPFIKYLYEEETT